MSKELLNRHLAKYVDIDAAEFEKIARYFRYKSFSKKEIIQFEGEACKNLYFVTKGALRAYCLDQNAKEATVMFAFGDWWITDMYCFLKAQPAMMTIEAMADTEVMQISKEHLERLFLEVPKFETFFRKLMQNAYTREQLRVIDSLTCTAEERYVKYIEKYPEISKVLTQKQIASYLGVSPEFLSGMLKKRRSLNLH